MSQCDSCKQEMTDKVPCDVELVRFPDGKTFERLKVCLLKEYEEGRNCHDCGSPPDTLHHPGCDNEVCPRCGQQLFMCDCNYISTTEYVKIQDQVFDTYYQRPVGSNYTGKE